jgi:hypothetical protein
LNCTSILLSGSKRFNDDVIRSLFDIKPFYKKLPGSNVYHVPRMDGSLGPGELFTSTLLQQEERKGLSQL